MNRSKRRRGQRKRGSSQLHEQARAQKREAESEGSGTDTNANVTVKSSYLPCLPLSSSCDHDAEHDRMGPEPVGRHAATTYTECDG